MASPLAAALVAWFQQSARQLPWRAEPRDPYAVWVSEAMLQQTRVETVLRYYAAFLQRFPTVEALASAREEDVMKAWEGLGYYRRARLLQAGARQVLARHGGRVPSDPAALADLPGFGPYTVGAVASLAFGAAIPAVDGNVLRVVSRLSALGDDVASPSARRAVEAWVREHQPPREAGPFNEALMELGATVCTPQSPACGACPLAAFCLARALARVDEFPVKSARSPARHVRVALAFARRGDLVLLERRDAGLLAGTWGLPWVEVPEGGDAVSLLAAYVGLLTGAPARVGAEPAAVGGHVFTHRKWAMEAYHVDTEATGGDWRAPRDVALGAAHRKMLGKLAARAP